MIAAITKQVRGSERAPLDPARDALAKIRQLNEGTDGLNAFLSVVDEADLSECPEGPDQG